MKKRPISAKARKKRLWLAKAPLHMRRRFLAANLSKELRRRYKKRSFPVRKGDTVKVMRGKFTGKVGKVLGVNLRKVKVFVEGIQRTKADGSKVNVPIDPSNLQILELVLEDKKRLAALKRK